MGVSPYYRGAACNFWALFDNRPSYVGATIHRLDNRLDTGDILFHCTPAFRPGDTCFDFSMRSVLVALEQFIQSLLSGELIGLEPVQQNACSDIRYSTNAEFVDDVAVEFLKRQKDFDFTRLSYPDLVELNRITYFIGLDDCSRKAKG